MGECMNTNDGCKNSVISLDIGGTNIRGAIVSGEYYENHKHLMIIPTDQCNGKIGALNQVVGVIENLIEKSGKNNIKGIGISVPGLIDGKNGIVQIALNLPDWENIKLTEFIQNYINLPVHIINDANAAALGYWETITNQKVSNLVLISIGTGIGAGIIIEKKLILGHNGIAGEIGHVSIDMDGPSCHECKKARGCFTTLASGRAIRNFILANSSLYPESIFYTYSEQKIASIRGVEIIQAAREGDSLARKAFARAGEAIGRSVVNTIHYLDPETIILSGGVMEAEEFIMPFVNENIQKYSLSNTPPPIEVIHSHQLGISGAASYVSNILDRINHDNR